MLLFARKMDFENIVVLSNNNFVICSKSPTEKTKALRIQSQICSNYFSQNKKNVPWPFQKNLVPYTFDKSKLFGTIQKRIDSIYFWEKTNEQVFIAKKTYSVTNRKVIVIARQIILAFSRCLKDKIQDVQKIFKTSYTTFLMFVSLKMVLKNLL